jgi:lipopolysaccharide export system permease protein
LAHDSPLESFLAQPVAFGTRSKQFVQSMKTIRRLIHGEIIRAVSFVAIGFLALFVFFDLVDQLQALSKNKYQGYQFQHALMYVGLLIPSHLYELLPISVLIGAIFVMARFAQSSEFTILRTGGLGPWRALGSLFQLGLVFVFVTFIFGDYISPWSDKQAQLLKAKYQGQITVGQTGAWLREKQGNSQFAVNVRALSSEGQPENIRIHEFDTDGRLLAISTAPNGVFTNDGAWLLKSVDRRIFHIKSNDVSRIELLKLPEWQWKTDLTAEMISAALLSPDKMKTIDLFQYVRHLAANGQSAQRYEIQFWRKVFYPLSCWVMLTLALPFAYLHFRSGNIAGYVFGGVMAGISFYLLNNVFGFMGNLQNWQPWLTAAAPAIIYSLVSLATFGWLVIRQ